MNSIFLNLLVCPETKEEFDLEIKEKNPNGTIKTGSLISKSSKRIYPIINSIPRFVNEESYSNSFGYEWIKWPKVQFESNNINTPMEGETKTMFNRMAPFSEDELKNKLVIDYGCGPGRFIELARNEGATVVGIDLSIAVEAARKNFIDDKNVLIIQGDVLNPPFKENTFDCGYTIGVLHHTPNPQKGLEKLVEIVKKEHKVACAVYGESLHIYSRDLTQRLRKFFSSRKSNFLALVYSYFSAYFLYYVLYILKRIPVIWKFAEKFERNNFIVLKHKSAKWRLLDTFDAITPYYASTHKDEELIEWFKTSGCNQIIKTKGEISYMGTKT